MAGEFHKLAPADEVGPGEIRGYELEGRKVALCNVDGELYAFENICTHAYAVLSEGGLQGDRVRCPLHGATFDVKTGEAKSLPAVKALPYPRGEGGGRDRVRGAQRETCEGRGRTQAQVAVASRGRLESPCSGGDSSVSDGPTRSGKDGDEEAGAAEQERKGEREIEEHNLLGVVGVHPLVVRREEHGDDAEHPEQHRRDAQDAEGA